MWKFKRYRIKWNPQKKKFFKIKRDRQLSRNAYMRWKKNRSKMMLALRRSRFKRKLSLRKSKARGIYQKLKIARERWKNIISSDMNMHMFIDLLLEDEDEKTIELSDTDIPEIKNALMDMRDNIELDDEKEQDDFYQFIDDSIEHLDDFENIEDINNEDEDFLADIVSFIEEYGEEVGIFIDDDINEQRKSINEDFKDNI